MKCLQKWHHLRGFFRKLELNFWTLNVITTTNTERYRVPTWVRGSALYPRVETVNFSNGDSRPQENISEWDKSLIVWLENILQNNKEVEWRLGKTSSLRVMNYSYVDTIIDIHIWIILRINNPLISWSSRSALPCAVPLFHHVWGSVW